MKKIVIATRGSKLALWQANHIKESLSSLDKNLEIELKILVTRGDKVQDRPLALIGGKGLFTKEIDEAMLRGEAQVAVHSMKDLPVVLPEELQLCAFTKTEDSRDALLSEKYDGLDALPQGATVGTTSLRRRMNLYAVRPDLNIVELRGNVDTRIRKLKEGQFDAIVLAAAGINRLGLSSSVQYFSPVDIVSSIPSMGQGALALQTIKDPFVIDLVSQLNDKNSMMEVTIERDFVAKLEGGCQVPIGISASVLGDGNISIQAIVGLPDGTELLQETTSVKESDYNTAGELLADKMIARGAKELLAKASAIAYK